MSRNGGFEWKDNTALIEKVINYIITQYPGDAKKDIQTYIDFVLPGLKKCLGQIKTVSIQARSAANEKKIDDIIDKSFELSKYAYDEKKLTDFFIVKTKKFGAVSIYDIAQLTPVIKKLLYVMITNCDYIRYMLNYFKYMCNICFSIDKITLLEQMLTGTVLKELVTSGLGISNQTMVSDLTMINKLISGILTENTSKFDTLKEMVIADSFLLYKSVVLSSKQYVYNVVMGKKPAAKKAATKKA